MGAVVVRWWRAYQRRIDKQILWPSCKAEAPDLETARAIMIMHSAMDPAWSDVSAEEAVDIISGWT